MEEKSRFAAVGMALGLIGWFFTPVISFHINKFFTYLYSYTSSKIQTLKMDTYKDLKQTLRDVEELRVLGSAKVGSKSELEMEELNDLDKNLKSALYEVEDILDLIEYHQIEKEVIGNNSSRMQHLLRSASDFIAGCKTSFEPCRFVATVVYVMLCSVAGDCISYLKSCFRPGENSTQDSIPVSHPKLFLSEAIASSAGSVSIVHKLRLWSCDLVVCIINWCSSVLIWLTDNIRVVRHYPDWCNEAFGVNNDQNDGMAIYFRFQKWFIRKRIEQIESSLTDSKSRLLNLKGNNSQIPVKDTKEKRSNNKHYSERDIDELHRKIERKVFGRDEERKHICGLLRNGPNSNEQSSSSSKGYSVIGIHGIEGSGKSTLAQYVCDHENEQQGNDRRFNIVMFILVSRSFNLRGIFCDMLDQMRKQLISDDKGPKGQRKKSRVPEEEIEELKKHLKGKRFLLVLDDVWVNNKNRAELNILHDVLNHGERGSGVLVTTQNAYVANILGAQLVPILELEETQYFSLFMHHALHVTGSFDDRKHIETGKKIAAMLKKSPIAAVTVAARLAMNPDIEFWKRTARRDVLKDTMGALWWSYEQLDADIRRCFAYCSTFPKGYKLEREKLVRMWVAHGFIKCCNKEHKDEEDLGQDYFDELLAFSFLQVHKTTDYFTIHDRLHRLAEMVAGSDFHRIGVNDSQEEISIPEAVRHLFIETCNGANIPEYILELGNLRTLIIEEKDISGTLILGETYRRRVKFFEGIFKKRLSKLRVLIIKIGDRHVFTVPASIDRMKHLRYLGLNQFSEVIFPRTIRKLYHMQRIDVYDFRPPRDEDMANLKHLQYYCSWNKIANIGKLTSLQRIEYFEVKKEQGYEIHQLKHLDQLRGFLYIRGLGTVGSRKEAEEAHLARKERLKELDLSFDIGYRHVQGEEAAKVQAEVLEGLCPPEGLEQLQISYYHGSVYPSWMLTCNHQQAPKNLKKLEFFGCTSQLADVPGESTSSFFACLRELHIISCSWSALPDHMERLTSLQELEIGYSDVEGIHTLPMSLKKLKIESCRAIKILLTLPESLQKLTVKRCHEIESLPTLLPKSLEKLKIAWCDQINQLPTLPESLKHISISGSSMLPRTCRKEGHINWENIQHIPEKDIYYKSRR